MSEEKLSAWQQYKKNLGDTRPWHMLDPTAERATEDKARVTFKTASSDDYVFGFF
jgi:hypothetical protein